MIAPMIPGPIHWKTRVAAFERERRRPLTSVLVFAASYLLILVALAYVAELGLDMRGHEASEEPIRSLLYHSIRTLFTVVCPVPFFERLSPSCGPLLALGVFLAGALAFGLLATLVNRRFRSATSTG